MSWISTEGFKPRPIVIVDDDLQDLEIILRIISDQASQLLGQATVVGLTAQSGKDSMEFVQRWLESYPDLQVAANLGNDAAEGIAKSYPSRFQSVPLQQDTSPVELSEAIAGMIRAGGFYLQDIQLESLHFVPKAEPWQSIYLLTNQIRALFPLNPPQFWLMSNKRAYPATFLLDLGKRGFDPKRVIEKSGLQKDLKSHLKNFLSENMPFVMHVSEGKEKRSTITLAGPEDQAEIFSSLDLVFWQPASRVTFGGTNAKKEIAYRDSNESKAWKALVADLFGEHVGVSKLQFAKWEAPDPEHQDRLEYAPKLAHKLRAKMHNGDLLVTIADGAYRLSKEAKIGWIQLFTLA